MAKKDNTVIQSYIKGAPQIKAFMKGEIGTEEAAKARLEKLKEKAMEISGGHLSNEQLEALKDRSKVSHHQYYKFYAEYGSRVQSFLNKKGQTFTKKDMEDIMAVNKAARTSGELLKYEKLGWKSESGIKAVVKYTAMLMENDYRKFAYYDLCLAHNKEIINPKNMLDVAVPARFKAPPADIEKYAKYFKALEEKLNKTEGFHVNSPEYNRMKKAIRAINSGFEKGIDYHPLGERFEELQAASMDYINAKGVGTQSSQRGIDRMDAALDICRLSSGGMGYFMSKERMDKVRDFEKRSFNMYFEYKTEPLKIGPVNEVYKANEADKAKEEIEENREL